MKKLWTILFVTAAACGSKTKGGTTSPPPVTADAAVATEPAPDAAPSGPSKEELLAAEQSAYETAKPVFEKYCSACHEQGGKKATAKKLGHFDMTSWPFGGHHTGEMGPKLREVLGIDGGKATMPDDHPGAVQGDDLARVAALADAWDKAEAGGAHPHEAGDDTDGDVDEH